MKDEERFCLCGSSAGWVGGKEKGVWGRFSVSSTVDQVAGSGDCLLGLPCIARVGDNCGAVFKKGKSS